MSSTINDILRLKNYLKRHLYFVWCQLESNDEERNDAEWFQNTFINKAVNSEEYNVYDMWSADDEFEISALLILEMLNNVKDWHRNKIGDEWVPPLNDYSIKTIMNGWADIEVQNWGVDEVRNIINTMNANAEEEIRDVINTMNEDAEDEIYTGTKDFPPNETDDNCPICLEAYTWRKPKDGVRNSEYKVRCPHYCCCDCWVELYDKNEGEKKRCPICRANITEWLEDVLPSFLPDYP